MRMQMVPGVASNKVETRVRSRFDQCDLLTAARGEGWESQQLPWALSSHHTNCICMSITEMGVGSSRGSCRRTATFFGQSPLHCVVKRSGLECQAQAEHLKAGWASVRRGVLSGPSAKTDTQGCMVLPGHCAGGDTTLCLPRIQELLPSGVFYPFQRATARRSVDAKSGLLGPIL